MVADDEAIGQAPRGRAIVARLCLAGAILPVTLAFLQFRAGGGGSDFWSFWDAARASLEGQHIYGSGQAFPYPPHSLFLFIPFGLMPFGWGLLLFNFAGIAFFAWTTKPYLPKGFPLLLQN